MELVDSQNYQRRHPDSCLYGNPADSADYRFLHAYALHKTAQPDGRMERLLSPFKAIGLPAHEIAMMMTIALRFIPTLLEETDKIMKAQQAKGRRLESGSLLQRVKSLIPILVPLFVSAFRIANDLAMAMEARCYRGGKHRTRMHEMKFAGRDYAAFALQALFLAVIIVCNRFF